MKVKVLKYEQNIIEFIIEGETDTFCNALREELLNDKGVTFAAYIIDHPLIGHPRFLVRTDGSKGAKEALIEASQRIKLNTIELRSKLKEALT